MIGFVSGYSERGLEGWITKVQNITDLRNRMKAINKERKSQNEPVIIKAKLHNTQRTEVVI